MKEYFCELHGRRVLLDRPDCVLCEPVDRRPFLKAVMDSYLISADEFERNLRASVERLNGDEAG